MCATIGISTFDDTPGATIYISRFHRGHTTLRKLKRGGPLVTCVSKKTTLCHYGLLLNYHLSAVASDECSIT